MAVVGIDLGTSNSCIAVLIDAQPQVVLDERGRSTTPSVVSINRQKQFFVGHLAKAQMSVNPSSTVHSAKRFLGQKFNAPNVQELLPSLSYGVREMPDGGPGLILDDSCLTPTQVSAAVLTKLKALAESALGESVTEAVISVPAHFDNVQRTATKRAAEIAGIEVMRLINEPTAAALAYGFGRQGVQNVVVYDFGGGTFDVSVLEIGDGIYNVLATGGDTFLGGNDFNIAIACWLAERFKMQTGIELLSDAHARQRVLDAAEFAKIQLSEMSETLVSLAQIAPDVDLNLKLNETLTRAKLNELCAPLVERSLAISDAVFSSSGLRKKDLNEIVLVGGMTRMPLVRQMVEKWFGRVPNTRINPDEAVGIGAALQATALKSAVDDVILLDVIPLSLGIDAAGGVFIPLIPKNTKVPHRASRIFTTNRDGQDRVHISIYQGENNYSKDNALLASFELVGIRDAKRMQPRIEVSLRVDVNGILAVTAIDLDTGQSQSVEVVDMTMRALEALENSPIEA